MPTFNRLVGTNTSGDLPDVVTAGLDARYGAIGGSVDVKKRLVNQAPRTPAVMASPPTVALSAASAATSIASGVTVAPKRLTNTGADGGQVDTANDPKFSYLGTVDASATYGTTFPDRDLANWTLKSLTGVPSSQVGTWQPRVGFIYTGTEFEILFKGLTNPNYYRLMVDGEYATEDMQALTIGNTGAVYRLKVTFATTATREIVVTIGDLRFGGLTIEPTGSVTKLPPNPLRAAIIADSYGGGAGEMRRRASVFEVACAHLGMSEVWNLSAGGTGYIANGSDGQPFSARISTDLPQTDPNVIFLAGGYNDRTESAVDIQAACEAAIVSTRAAKPNAVLFVVGVWSSGTPDASEVAANAAVKAAATAQSAYFIDPQDPTGIYADAEEYTSAIQYRIGDYAIYSGTLYVAIAFSNAIAFDSTKWRAASVINGTGYVGSTTGNGNADVLIQSDATHPTIAGAKLLGAFVARRAYDLLRADLLAA